MPVAYTWVPVIVVDSSVWINHFRDVDTAAVATLRDLKTIDDILVGDIVLLEVLQGARTERHALEIERRLRVFEIRAMLDERLAVRCAGTYRRLRSEGITIRKTIDLIIATFCVDGGHSLLHDDRDFDLMKDVMRLTTL